MQKHIIIFFFSHIIILLFNYFIYFSITFFTRTSSFIGLTLTNLFRKQFRTDKSTMLVYPMVMFTEGCTLKGLQAEKRCVGCNPVSRVSSCTQNPTIITNTKISYLDPSLEDDSLFEFFYGELLTYGLKVISPRQ